MALTIQRGYTASSGETWTPTKQNNSTVPVITVATGTLVGRSTVGTGPIEEIILGDGFAIVAGTVTMGWLDTNATHRMRFACGSDLTADRTITFAPGDANRTLTLTGNATLNQDVSTAGSPTLAGLAVTGSISAELNGGNIITGRFNSGNPRTGLYVMGGQGNTFFGSNLNYVSANTFNYDTTAPAWAIAGQGSLDLGIYFAASGTAGTTAFDFSTINKRIVAINAGGIAVAGSVSATIGSDAITLGGLGVGYLIAFSRANANYLRAINAGGHFVFETGGANERARINDAGLAVTGSFNATGSISTNIPGTSGVGYFLRSNADFITSLIRYDTIGSGSTLLSSYSNVGIMVGATGAAPNTGLLIGTFSTGGLVLTGGITLTGVIESSTTGAIMRRSGASLNQQFIQIGNTGGDTYFGKEGNVAGSFFTGSSAYATVIYNTGGQPIQNIIGGVAVGTFSSGGLAVVGTVSATQFLVPNNAPSFAAGSFYYSSSLGVVIGAKTGSTFDFALYNPAGTVQLIGNNTGTSTLILSGTVTTSAAGLGVTGIAQISSDIVQSGAYHNFSATQGAGGYGIRSNGGSMEFKNSGGAWAAIGGGGGGGTVTNVGIAGNNGISVSGSPVTGSGTMTLGLGAITPSSVNVSGAYSVGGTQVVGARSGAIANISLTTGGFTTDASIHGANYGALIGVINSLLGMLRTHGLIAP